MTTYTLHADPARQEVTAVDAGGVAVRTEIAVTALHSDGGESRYDVLGSVRAVRCPRDGEMFIDPGSVEVVAHVHRSGPSLSRAQMSAEVASILPTAVPSRILEDAAIAMFLEGHGHRPTGR